jgi:predicted nucleic acid-binding protein
VALTAPGATSAPLLLADKSALVRGVEHLADESEVCLCPVTRLEMLYSARTPGEYVELDQQLDTFRQLRMDAETFDVAQSAQRELAERSQHRIPVPDLLVGACAHQHGAGVLHVDRHYETLATVLAIDVVEVSGNSARY